MYSKNLDQNQSGFGRDIVKHYYDDRVSPTAEVDRDADDAEDPEDDEDDGDAEEDAAQAPVELPLVVALDVALGGPEGVRLAGRTQALEIY